MLLICPDFSYRVKRGLLCGRSHIVPSEGCRRYFFELSYRVGESPKITILEPRLTRRADGEKIPHTYSDDEPCLFRPWSDWSGEAPIAFTVIPWLALWLFYYEIWHATGVWLGGGEHLIVNHKEAESNREEAA
jgi:hypothetical protein